MLAGEDPAGLAVPVISIDDRGLPHPALLSLHELILWKEDLYFFLSQGSRSSGYLERRRAVVLIFIDPLAATYLKGHARLLGRSGGLAVFRLDISVALEDFASSGEGQAEIVSSTRFEADPELMARRRQIRKRVRNWLQSLV